MPYDAGVAAAVCYELMSRVEAADGRARIEKILQPAKEQIILRIYAKGESFNLCLDADANSPKVYITNQTAENPPSMSAFYSILRKYLINAKISGVSLIDFDRIFEFRLDASDEMGFSRTLWLYVECIRKQSNIILCGESKKIIASLKTVDFSTSELRQVLNGFEYIKPLSGDKKNPLEISGEEFLTELENDINSSPDISACDWLLSKYQGMSPLITREIAFIASKSLGDAFITIEKIDRNILRFYFFELINQIKNNKFTPVVLFDDTGEKLLDFSYINIRQYGNKSSGRNFESMSELIDFYFDKKDRDNRIKQKSLDIFKVLANASSRLNKKIKVLERELEECGNRDKFRIYGDLITANIYKLKKGEEKYFLENFYEENMPVTEIHADKNLTPSQNAQKFYKKYNKLKSAEYHLTKQTELTNNDIIYIDSVFESLTRALSERELSEIRLELTESGFMKPLKRGKTEKISKSGVKKQKQLPVSKPQEFKSANGFKILCGRNNKQNDELTFRTASKNDIWFHAQKIPGSHVILLCDNAGRSPEDKDIEDAAKIAAAFSKGRNMPLVPVDYAYARYVKKPGGAKPGFVTYSNFKTAIVKPGE
ncbi:MAG: NFACT family protein [Oscillospiraceae bacterium]|nr:NFACT family protein [Oscillospiraceae bacterium]